MPIIGRFKLERPNSQKDNFFLWSMVILPIISEGAYIFDAWYFLAHFSYKHSYIGLVSTVLTVFSYLRYCAPIESPKMLVLFYIITWILNEIGTAGYLVVYVVHHQTFNIIIYSGWAILQTVMTGALIYYRVHRKCAPTFHVECAHLFHFISRLEVILAIFIPFFMNNISVTLTEHSIAFFLLFDFFAESYSRFQGVWIKSVLYLFVCTVTVCVTLEWANSGDHKYSYEVVASTFELISGCLCNLLIILQFHPFHFKPAALSQIAREELILQRKLSSVANPATIIIEAPPKDGVSTDTVIQVEP